MSRTELPLADQPTASAAVSCCPPVLDGALSTDDAELAATVFKALGDPVRLRLLSLIQSAGEACVCDLPALVDRSQPTVSHHLKVLAEAGLVRREQRGRWAWFHIDQDSMAAVRQALA